MLWFLIGVIVFLAVLGFVYRWAAARAPKGAFRGQGRFGGAGVVEKFREDDPQSKPTDEPSD